MICSVSRVEKVGKCDQVERKDESGESEVEIHMNCPSNAGSWESELINLREDTESVSVVSSSAEVLGFEADDELSSDATSFQSEEEIDNGKGEACAEGEPGPSGVHGTPKLPPRSSKWKQVYSKKLEQMEQLAEEKLKRKPRRRPRTKHIRSQKEETHANKIRIIKKIKNAVKKAAAQKPNSSHAALPSDETIARIFGVAAEDCCDTCSSSSSSESTRTSTEASWNSSISSDEEQPKTGRHFREVQTASAGVKTKLGKGVEKTSHVAASWESFSKPKTDFQKASTARPCNRVNLTSESAKNGRKGANTTGSANSWDSSTTLEEEYEESKVGQTGATANSWDSSTTAEEEFEQEKIACSWPFRVFKSISDSEKNGKMGATASAPFINLRDSPCSEEEPVSESSSSWRSSKTLDEDVQKPSTPEREKNVQLGARTKSCSSTNSHEDINQLTLKSENNGQKKARKARRWFRFKTNKVDPLQ